MSKVVLRQQKKRTYTSIYGQDLKYLHPLSHNYINKLKNNDSSIKKIKLQEHTALYVNSTKNKNISANVEREPNLATVTKQIWYGYNLCVDKLNEICLNCGRLICECEKNINDIEEFYLHYRH